MNKDLEDFSDEELIEEIEARGAMPEAEEPEPADIGDFSDDQIAEEFERREISLDLVSVLDYIEKQLWTPSDWERLQNALAVAVKPRGAE